MAKVKKNLEKSTKSNVITTAEKKNSPKNRVKSVIKKAKKEKTVDEDKAKNIVKNLVKAKDLQNQLEKAPKKIQEIVQGKTKKNKQKVQSPEKKKSKSPEKKKPKSPEKKPKSPEKKPKSPEKKPKSPEEKKPAEVTVDSLNKVVEKSTNIALDTKTVESAVNSLFHLLENDDKVKLFDDQEERFLLQIKCIKVPIANPMIKRITLKHGKLNANSDICFIVNDYKKPKDVDKTIEFYEKIFEMHNITNIKCIMPFYTASTEYAEYENQRRLVELYDSFLIDASIANKFSTMFRAVFIKRGKMPRMIRMRATNLKDQVEKSLKMVPLKICDGRDSYLVEFGHHLMKKQEIVENLNHVVQELNNVFPGGHNNIRNMYVKTPTGDSIPLYHSLANSADVEIPVVKRKLPKAFKDVRGELSTFTDAEVIVKPYGEVILVRNKEVQSLGDDEDIEEEEDIEDEVPNKIRKVDEDVALPVEKKKKGKGKNKRQLETEADTEIIEPKEKQVEKEIEEVKSTEVAPQKPKGKGKAVKQPAEVTPVTEKVEIEQKPKDKGKKNKKSNEATQKASEVITEKPKGKSNKNMKPSEETVEIKSDVTAEKPKGKGNKNMKPNVETTDIKKDITEKTKGKGKNNPTVETKSEVVVEKTKAKGKNAKPIEVVQAIEEVTEKTKGKGKKNTKPIEVVEEICEEVVEKKKGKKNAKPIVEPVEVKSDVSTEKPKGKGKKNNGAKEEVAKEESNEKIVGKKQKGKGKNIKPAEETVASPEAPIVQKPKAKKTNVESEAVSEVATNQPKKNNKRKLVETKPVEAVPAIADNKNAAKKGKNSEKEAAVLAKSESEKVKPAVNGAQKKMNSPAGKNKKKKKNLA